MKHRRQTRHFILHCSATPPSMDIGHDEIDRWHRSRGWQGIGYHYVIRRDGTLEGGRDPRAMGAHAKGHNAESVGICMVGGSDIGGAPDNNFTGEQFDTLRELLEELRVSYPHAVAIGHNEVSGKDCPSFDVQVWLKQAGLAHMAVPEGGRVCPECGQTTTPTTAD